MAGYDGSVRINTKIDTKSAEVQLSALENRMAKTADKVSDLRSKMDALKGTKIPTQEYQEITKQIEKAEAEFNKLLEKQEQMQREGKASGVSWERLNQKIEETGNTIRYAKGELQDLVDNGKAFALGEDTQQYANLSRQLEYTEKDLSVMAQRHELLNSKIENAKSKYQKLGDTAKKSFSKIDKSAKKTGGLMSTLGNRFKGLALSLLIFNQISKAFNAMSRAIRGGFENLYKDNEKFKQSVDGLKASCETLKNSFAAAFRPLVEIAIPYIQRLMDYLSRLLGMFGQFTALITGQKTYTKAIKQTASATKEAAKAAEGYLSPLDEINKYSDGSGGSGDAGGAGTMFEEAPINPKLIEVFDKISAYAQKLKAVFNQGFWDGLGDWEYRWESIKQSIGSIKDSFSDIWSDPAVLSSMDRYVQSVAYMLGSLVGALASIGLTIGANLIGGLAKYLEENKDRIKSHLISMFDIWTDINYLLSDLFQSIAYVFEAFASENGQQLTANVIGIFVDAFMGVAEYISKLIRDILNLFIQPFVDNKEEFRTALEGFLGVLSEVTGTIKQGIDGTFDKLSEVYDKHVKPFFDSLSQGISDLTGEFLEFWNGNVQPILEHMASKFDDLWKNHIQPFINNAIDYLGKIIDAAKVLWEEVLQPFISWLVQNILPVILPVIQAIWDAVFDFVAFIMDVASSIMEILGGVIDFLVGVFTGDWERAFGGIRDIVDGVLRIITGIVELFINNIKNVIEIGLSIIKGIIDAILAVIKGVIENTIGRVQEIVFGGTSSIQEAFSSFKEDLHRVWEQTWGTIGNAVQSAVNAVKSTVQAFFDWISEKVGGIIDAINSIGKKSSISGGIGSKFLSSSFSSGGGYFRAAPNPAFASLANVPIPGYANGQVIPTTMKKHLAILGDNPTETEVVSPLSTIRQAQKEALAEAFAEFGLSGGGGEQTVIIKQYLDGKQVAQAVIKEGKVQQMATGNNIFMLE